MKIDLLKLRRRTFLQLLLATSITLLIRIDDVGYAAKSLWADDGYVLINQLYEIGVPTLWTPANGQQYLYLRLVTLLTGLSPESTPFIFFFGWLLSFYAVIYVLSNRERDSGLNRIQIIFLACAIALQPNYKGDPFFALYISHFFLGVALAFHICIPSRNSGSKAEILFLTVTSLSGPFSAFLIPVLAFQWANLRDFSSRRSTYTIVTACGLLQACFILQSRRIETTPLSPRLADWLDAFSTLLTFGGHDTLTRAAAGAFWIITVIFLGKWSFGTQRSSDRLTWISPLAATLAGLWLFVVTALAAGAGLLPEMSPIGLASRYFIIPYSLAFYVALVCTSNHKAANTAIISLICMICASALSIHGRADSASRSGAASHRYSIQWTAHVKFQQVKPDLVIPINPIMAVDPPFWNARLKGYRDDRLRPTMEPVRLTPLLRPASGNSASSAGISSVYFDLRNHCATNTHIALEIDIWRADMGWARLSWGTPEEFDAARTMERFYAGGNTTMQFAFRRDTSDYLIRLSPAMGVQADSLDDTLFMGMRSLLTQGGAVVGTPTPPGGATRIAETRLYCLQ
ncbi:hypothetical protein [Peristeroidobacter soli]|uniref:hypothetical protein n=1 Tax=Peristeroidobacter soli TaxID=2497877 RepID=UPI00101B7747|nr:hypothetical protein [Peristeroidobacter soli]